MNRFEGKVVAVTGGASGTGEASYTTGTCLFIVGWMGHPATSLRYRRHTSRERACSSTGNGPRCKEAAPSPR